MMNKPMLYVDFNEMLESNLVLLSAEDNKADIEGKIVPLYEGLKVIIYMDDIDEYGKIDNLVATGVVEKNILTGWAQGVKWCCRIDEHGIRHQSECDKFR